LLPRLGVRKIAREFGATRHLTGKAKDLNLKRDILTEITAKKGKQLPQKTVDLIINFYNTHIA